CPLSELVAAYERLRALDLRIFFVSGWSQGKDSLLGTPLAKLPSTGTIGLDYSGNSNDALALALLSIDMSGAGLDRVKIDDRGANALLHAKGGSLVEQDAPKQEEVVVSTREAARLLPYVLLAPR